MQKHLLGAVGGFKVREEAYQNCALERSSCLQYGGGTSMRPEVGRPQRKQVSMQESMQAREGEVSIGRDSQRPCYNQRFDYLKRRKKGREGGRKG